jgi:hypothetical protein
VIPPFTPYAPLGSPANLVRRFGVAKRRFRHWLLDCTTAPWGHAIPWRSAYTPRPALFLDEKK